LGFERMTPNFEEDVKDRKSMSALRRKLLFAAQEYAVSRTTIRAAIQSLVQRGLVEIRRNQVPSWDSGIAENPLRPGSWQESCEGPAQIGVKISYKGVGVTALS
jgi:DNA-binding transcriptional MocR family regulator